jgi:predicted hydrocarbon binding protein
MNIIYINIIINVILFVLGYIIGKISIKKEINKPKSFFDSHKTQNKNNVSIDEKKVVVSIDTSTLEKKYDSLGEIKQTQENISGSINKLKNLKR